MGLLSNCPACCGQFKTILITFEGYLNQRLHIYLFNIVHPLWYANGGLPSIILTSRGILVKMLITLESHDIFQLNFAHQYIIIISKPVIRPCQVFLWQSLISVLHTCVSIMSVCIRTHFYKEPISEKLC